MENKKFSVIYPPKDALSEYLSTFFTVKPLDSIEISEKLLLKEKEILEKIHDADRGLDKLEAWKKYYRFVSKNLKKDELRIFLFLEHCTKAMISENDIYNSSDYLDFWVSYANKCVDESEIFNFLRKREIGINLAKFYYYMSIHYEQEHKFEQANQIFLEGFSKNLADQSFLKNSYNIFEQRMENRLNRELIKSKFKNEELYNYIQKELNKSGDFKSDLCKFSIKGNKINFLENSNINTLKHGDINVYIDPENRKKLVTRCSQIVEIHKALSKILAENDEEYKRGLKEFQEKYKSDLEKKPFSWLNNLRILSKNIQENVSQQVNLNNNSNFPNQFRMKKPNQETVTNYQSSNLEEVKTNINGSKIPSNLEKLLNTLKNTNYPSNLGNTKSASEIVTNFNTKNLKTNEKRLNSVSKKIKKEEMKVKFDPVIIVEKCSPEQDNNEKKIRLVKKENTTTKPVKMYINLERLKDKETGRYLSFEEAKSIKYFKAIEEKKKEEESKKKHAERLKKKRKTIIYHVDSDGDIIMSSDEDEDEKEKEEEILKNYLDYSKKKLLAKKYTEENSINLWDSIEKNKADLLEEMRRIEQLIDSKLINEEQKKVLFEDLESKMIHMEELNKYFEEKKNKKIIRNPQVGITNAVKNSPVRYIPNELINYLPDSTKDQLKGKVGKIEKNEVYIKETDPVFEFRDNGCNFPVSSISNANIKNKDITNNIFSTVTRSIDFSNISFDDESNRKKISRPEEVYNSLFPNFKEETDNKKLNYLMKNEISVKNSSNNLGSSLGNTFQQGLKQKNENVEYSSQRNNNNIKLIINNNNNNNYTSLNNINFDNKNNFFSGIGTSKNTENEKSLNRYDTGNFGTSNTFMNKNPVNDNNYSHLTSLNIEYINKVNSKKKGLCNLFGNSNEKLKEDLMYKLSNITEKQESIYEEEYSFLKKN